MLRSNSDRAHRIVLVVYPGTQLLDLAGPLDVFNAANAAAGKVLYSTAVASHHGGAVRTSSRVALDTVSFASLRSPIDTLLVTGGPGTAAAMQDTRLIRALAKLTERSSRIASVCSGAFLLGGLGLLDGKRATTHWAWCDLLAKSYPAAEVEPDALYVVAGNIWTSAGVTAGIDLALAIVARDAGGDIANEVARQLVVYVKRSGGQSQFSARQVVAPDTTMSPLSEVLRWMENHLADDLSVAALARRANMSERHFARVFRAETKATPGDYVELMRLELAQGLLQRTTRSLPDIAREAGFGTVATMHRVFQRRLGTTPGMQREHFSTARTS